MEPRIKIGKLLVQAGIISEKTLERALDLQKGSIKRLGEILHGMGIVNEQEIIDALARQCDLRIVRNFADQPFSKELLDLVPAETALEKIVFPLKHSDKMLALAVLDPFDKKTFDDISQKTGMKIHPVLSTKEEILSAVKKHYLNVEKTDTGMQKILLIDNSQVLTEVLELAIQKEGFEVLVANDGKEGLKLAMTHQPDLIICDQFMPRMDGYAFIRSLRMYDDTESTPVILMTVKASLEEELKALKAGFIDFISKPSMPVQVIARIKRAFAIMEYTRQTKSHKTAPALIRENRPEEIKEHGGTVETTSSQGTGSTLTGLLSAIPDGCPEDEAINAPAEMKGSGKILVMDDEDLIRGIAVYTLEFLGYEVVACTDGLEAVEQFRWARENNVPFSAVILDLTVPDGMGGEEAAARILAIDPEAVLIVSSGYSNDPVLSDFRQFGFSSAVPKPFDAEGLASELKRLISKTA